MTLVVDPEVTSRSVAHNAMRQYLIFFAECLAQIQASPGSDPESSRFLNMFDVARFARKIVAAGPGAKETHPLTRQERYNAAFVFTADLAMFVHREVEDFLMRAQSWQATKAARKRFFAWLRRYQTALRVVTEGDSPFPSEIKKVLDAIWASAHAQQFSDECADSFRAHFVSTSLFDKDPRKILTKHTFWRHLQKELFRKLREYGLSRRKSHELIAELFCDIGPEWEEYADLEGTIRHNVKN